MEPTKSPTFEDSVAQVMQTLPPVIRNYLGQGKYSIVANRLMTKYGLHIDQGGVLEREIMLLLMGIDNPDEFVKALAEEAKLDQQTINSITRDVNDQIFVPLREEMRKGSQRPAVTPAAPKPPAPVQPMNTVIIPANPTLPPKAPQTLTPTSNYAPKPPPPRSINLIAGTTEQRSALREALNVVTTGQKPASTNRMLEDHEEPHIEFKKVTPPNPFGAFSVRRPPTNLPGAMPPRPTPPEPPVQPRPTPNASPKATQGTAPPPVKPYTVDPYHEPIDEK